MHKGFLPEVHWGHMPGVVKRGMNGGRSAPLMASKDGI